MTQQPDPEALFVATTANNDASFQGGDWLLFFGISLIWGASFLLIAESLESFNPGLVTFGRVSLGALVLAILRIAGHRGERIATADRGRVLLLGVVWVGVPFTLYPLAQESINSAVTGLLNGATPVWVAVVGLVFVKVAPRPLQIIGLLLGFVGIALISLGSAAEGSSQLQGVVMVIAATVCYGFAFNIAPPLQARYGAVVLMSSVLGAASIVTLPYMLVTLGGNEWAWQPAIALFVLGAIGTGIAYWVMATLVGRVGSLRSSLITYLIPVVALLLGVSLRGDTVTALALIGAPVTIFGAYLASRSAG